MKTMNWTSVALVVLSLATSGCLDWWPEIGIPASGSDPWGELNPIQGMHASPTIHDQEEGMLYPPAETVPISGTPSRVGVDATEIALDYANPVAITEESLRYGKLQYETTCVVCHGPAGLGNGFVVGEGKYPAVPALTSARARGFSDAKLFQIITYGQGTMWSYKSQLKPLERWAVVNYVRALQRAEYPEPQDVERARD